MNDIIILKNQLNPVKRSQEQYTNLVDENQDLRMNLN